MVVSKEKVREIDISRPARALYFLRLTDYLLVIVCGNLLAGILAQSLVDPEMRQPEVLIINFAIIVPALLFFVYTGWRHVGVIDGRVWRSHLIAFPLLLLFTVVAAVILLAHFTYHDNTIPMQLILFQAVVTISAGAGLGLWSVLLLRRIRIATFEITLVELLRDLSNRRRLGNVDATKIKRVDAPRGTVFGVLGGLILLAVALVPMPDDPRMVSNYLRISQLVNMLGFFLLIRARRYFQISADSLLSVDKRSPILFLRSFEDDEKVKFGNSEKAILDFSLETRLSNHFTGFGPFIAVGSPKQPVPQIGAARVVLPDDAWQSKVMAWMEAANAIVMYAGKSRWVTWELAKVVNTGRVPKLILMIPEMNRWRRWFRWMRAKDIAARIDYVREAFVNTKWRGALDALQNVREVRAMLFRSDGSLIVIKSRPRNRDSYHLAALIAHYILLKETTAMLIGIGGIVRDHQFPVDTEIFHIGAAPDNNLIIKHDAYVSGHHAVLRYEKGSLSIADQHSKNGTFVNGNRLAEVPMAVNAGDQICLGHSIFEVARAASDNRLRAT